MNHFVTVEGLEVATNLTKNQAIKIAIAQHNKNPKLGTLQIGIGRTEIKNNKKVYSLHPYNYYL